VTLPLVNSSRLLSLVRQFHRAVERQRRYEEEWIATFKRVASDPHVRRLIREMARDEESER
jgi:hypothetical protein